MDVPAERVTMVADPQGAVCSATAVPGGPVRGVDGSCSLAPDVSGGSNLSDSTGPRLTFERRSRNPGVV
jgi:hypothetical protein